MFHNDKDPLNELYEGIEDVIGGLAGNLGTDIISSIESFAEAIISAITGVLNEGLFNVEAGILGSLKGLITFFDNLEQILGGLNLADIAFNVETAAQNFVNNILAGTGLVPILDNAGHLVSDTLQPLIDAISAGFGGAAGLGFTALQSLLTAIPGSQAIVDEIYDTLTSTAGTGHTLAELVSALEAFPATFVTGALTSAATVSGTAITTLLQHINSSGLFNAASITGAINSAVTFSGTALSTLLQYLNSSGQFSAAQVTGALNAAVTLSGTALSTLSASWNGAVSDLAAFISAAGGSTAAGVGAVVGAVVSGLTSLENSIIAALDGIGSGFTGVGAALAAIPFINVLSPWLTNIGAGIMAFADSIVSGLNLETTTGNNPAQAGEAGTLIANAVNSANTIAASVAATIAAQAISNPAYFGIDATAAAAYPLQTLAGTTAPTINVTQSSPAAIYIDTPNGGVKQSIAWLGDGTLTNITALYINVYSVNTSTNVATWMWSSNNIISAVSGGAVPLWNYANIPVASYITTSQGQKYVAEIQVLGSSTYKIVGVTGNWLNNNTAVTIGTQGATRTPVTNLSSVTSNSLATSKNPSWTLTTVTNDNCVIVDAVGYSTASNITAMTATFGGVAMTQKSFTTFTTIATDGQSAVLVQFELHNSLFAAFSTGAKTIAVTTTGGGTSGTQCAVQAVATSYQNISAVSSATATTGNSASPSQTVTGLTANSPVILHSMMSNAIDNWTANNQNLIANINGAAFTEPTLVQDQLSYATSVPFTGTLASGTGKWAASVVPLTVTRTTPLQVPASTFTPTGSNNLPWFAMCGSAGVSQHSPETKKYTTSGSKTFTVPAWAQTAAAAGGTVKFDIVLIGAGKGGNNYDGSNDPYGGDGGSWTAITLTYGAGGGIPLTTTSFSLSIGAGGAGGAAGGVNGSNGANTTCTITGYGTITANGATTSGSSSDGYSGGSPGDEVFDSTTYYGGLETPTGSGDGSKPGGGGPVGADATGLATGAGAPGAGFITTYQA